MTFVMLIQINYKYIHIIHFYSLIQILFHFSPLFMLLIRKLSFDINVSHYLFHIPVAPMARHILPDHSVQNGSRTEEAGPDRGLRLDDGQYRAIPEDRVLGCCPLDLTTAAISAYSVTVESPLNVPHCNCRIT